MNITCHEKPFLASLVAFAVSRQSLPHGNKDAEYTTSALRGSQSKASSPFCVFFVLGFVLGTGTQQ